MSGEEIIIDLTLNDTTPPPPQSTPPSPTQSKLTKIKTEHPQQQQQRATTAQDGHAKKKVKVEEGVDESTQSQTRAPSSVHRSVEAKREEEEGSDEEREEGGRDGEGHRAAFRKARRWIEDWRVKREEVRERCGRSVGCDEDVVVVDDEGEVDGGFEVEVGGGSDGEFGGCKVEENEGLDEHMVNNGRDELESEDDDGGEVRRPKKQKKSNGRPKVPKEHRSRQTTSKARRVFTPEEDQWIEELYEQFPENWNRITEGFNKKRGVTTQQLRKHYRHMHQKEGKGGQNGTRKRGRPSRREEAED
ncbi:hypothetical protein HDV00_001443 [Rhizophlyctis rosea]|nr:hypothetical protein HDV00_001443 [Rhizophlyctis rosea]